MANVKFRSGRGVARCGVFGSRKMFPIDRSMAASSARGVIPMSSVPVTTGPTVRAIPRGRPTRGRGIIPQGLIPTRVSGAGW